MLKMNNLMFEKVTLQPLTLHCAYFAFQKAWFRHLQVENLYYCHKTGDK